MISKRYVAFMLLAVYICAAVFYGITLELTSYGGAGQLFERMTLDYGLKALVSLPIVWFVFRVMQNKNETFQIAIAAFLAIPFAFAWQWLYYAVADSVGIGHMGGNGSWWDIYIPTLVYFIQFLILFMAQYHNRSLAASLRAEKLASLAKTSELVALKAQVNPHFLFNTFNAISASLPPEQEDTRVLLAQLADLFRYQVEASKLEEIPLRQELQFLADYLKISQVRMGKRLVYSIHCDPDIDELTMVAPMLLQPLVENAIVHGLSPKLEGGRLSIWIIKFKAGLKVSVEDDGVGFDESLLPTERTGTGVGLTNTRRRLELKYGVDLVVDSKLGNGTRISYTLPVLQPEKSISFTTSNATIAQVEDTTTSRAV